ncbi:MAG: hydantoinase B/oxoprolinase family protein [Candidatus Tectomicrobia bacterium]|nr:hydantoinase B/oxoprolinase family protein [Candidatus Tectomicrobia bacterium]
MSPFDAITLELMWSRLISIAQEQARALVQASFSTLVGETEDIASGIYDAQGNIIAQGVTGTQGILIGMGRGIKHILAQFPPERLRPGDVLICNDPWLFTGHKFDITIAMPVFLGGRFVGMTGTVSHATDVGGIKSPGDSEEVYEEGLHIPILKLYKAGKLNEDVHEMIRSNVRMETLVMGDLMAQVAACEVGQHKVQAFLREYELDSLEALSTAIMERTEAAVKAAIRAFPDGSWSHTVLLDGMEEPLQVRARLTVQGEEMLVDFAGSSPQTTRGAINAVKNFTDAYTLHAIKTLLLSDVPNNEGFFRSVRIEAPAGTIVNASFPAPVMSRQMMTSFVSSAVFGCLTQALPGRVIAESGITQMGLINGHDAGGRPYVYWLLGFGGMGGRPGMDGHHATNFPANIGNVPVEIIEALTPVRVVRKGLIPDSGGAGKWRGGCDQEITVTVASPYPATINCFFERTTVEPRGYHGGRNGRRAIAQINGREVHPKRKALLQPGDELTYSSCGGGGLFPAEERDAEAVLRDVLEGYVSVEAARRDYKVALDLATLTVDAEETAKLRRDGM